MSQSEHVSDQGTTSGCGDTIEVALESAVSSISQGAEQVGW